MIAGAHRNGSSLLQPTLEHLGRFDQGMGVGLPDDITVHLDAGYDSAKTRDLLDELGCDGVISQKGFPLQAGKRWVGEHGEQASRQQSVGVEPCQLAVAATCRAS